MLYLNISSFTVIQLLLEYWVLYDYFVNEFYQHFYLYVLWFNLWFNTFLLFAVSVNMSNSSLCTKLCCCHLILNITCDILLFVVMISHARVGVRCGYCYKIAHYVITDSCFCWVAVSYTGYNYLVYCLLNNVLAPTTHSVNMYTHPVYNNMSLVFIGSGRRAAETISFLRWPGKFL